MTAQASPCPAAPSGTANTRLRRPVLATWAQWAAVLTVLVALLSAGICVTCVSSELPIASTH